MTGIDFSNLSERLKERFSKMRFSQISYSTIFFRFCDFRKNSGKLIFSILKKSGVLGVNVP
jgi:hypothetical protein